jgi:hypothetical protein
MAAADYTHTPGPEDIMAFLDGEGTAASRTAIEAHLGDCAACQVLASEQRQLSVEMNAWTVGPPPASLRAPRPRQRRLLGVPVPLWIPSAHNAASLAAGAALGIFLLLGVAEYSRNVHYSKARVMTYLSPEDSDSASVAAPAYGNAQVGEPPPLPEAITHPELNAQLERRDLAQSSQAAARPSVSNDLAQPVPRKPSIIRTAKLRIVTKDFTSVKAAVEQAVTAAGGFVDHLTATSEAGLVRSVRGVVRIPADRLDAVTARLRQLGQVLEDTQGSEDVTDQLVDLDARLRSARATERRLTDLLANRTAKLSDVLEVERELARVRIEIERLDAEATNVGRRVSYAALTLEIMEERKAGLTPGPLSFASRFRVAARDGIETAAESVVSALLAVMEIGPLLLLWAVPIGSAWLILRRVWRARTANSGS